MRLKPCPWCKEPIVYSGHRAFYFVTCIKCKCTGPKKSTEADAIKAWNRRSK